MPIQDDDQRLCPFSKPILGQWCACNHARVNDRCSGKMWCSRAEERRDDCLQLYQLLRQKARFTLNIRDTESEISHALAMKIKCGGLLGMQRLLEPDSEKRPDIVSIIDLTKHQYGDVQDFPYGNIVRDIAAFSHRKSKRSKSDNQNT